MLWCVIGNEFVDPANARTPDVFEFVEHRCNIAETVDITVRQLLAAVASFDEQTCLFEHDYVLLQLPVEVRRERDPEHVAIDLVRTELQSGVLHGGVSGRR
jgi:hypothetical protein